MKKLLFVAIIALMVFSMASVALASDRGVFGPHWMHNTISKMKDRPAYDPSNPDNDLGWRLWAKKWLTIFRSTTIQLNNLKSDLDLPLSRVCLEQRAITWRELGQIHKNAVKNRRLAVSRAKWALNWKWTAEWRLAHMNDYLNAKNAYELGLVYKEIAGWISQM